MHGKADQVELSCLVTLVCITSISFKSIFIVGKSLDSQRIVGQPKGMSTKCPKNVEKNVQKIVQKLSGGTENTISDIFGIFFAYLVDAIVW